MNTLFQTQESIIELTPKDTLGLIRGMFTQRKYAIEMYPHAKRFRENADALARIELAMLEIETQHLMPKTMAVRLLRMERDLQFIAPRTTNKIFKTYMDRLDAIMNLLREVTGYVSQKSSTHK